MTFLEAQAKEIEIIQSIKKEMTIIFYYYLSCIHYK